ncbi:MAG: hypothetical protein LBI18_06755 [Planctomycetaceae bacterium]|nr:hypothetical protein [Planctomycetaceae bacterium]
MFRRNITLPQGNSDPVLSWQFVLPSCLESDCQPNTRASRLSPTQPWMKILRRKVAHLLVNSYEL